jgi:hypothetical protein
MKDLSLTKWIAGGLGTLALIFISYDRANLEARVTTVETQGSAPVRERMAVVETRLEYITKLLEEIKADLDDNRRNDHRAAP